MARRSSGERWTPLIIRYLHLGCENFGEILEGAARPLPYHCSHSGSNSSNASGIVEVTPKALGRGRRDQLTTSGDLLFKV